MVDRINHQKYYDYSKVNQQKRQTTEAAEFNLNTGKEGVIYEKEQQKKPAKSKEASLELEGQNTKEVSGSGVQLEISHKGLEKSVREKQRKSLVEEVKRYASLAVDFLKSVWDKVWNDNSSSKTAEFPEILEDKLSEQGASQEMGFLQEEEMGLPGQGAEWGASREKGFLPGEEGGLSGEEALSGTGFLQRAAATFWEEREGDGSRIKFSNQIAESIYTQEEIRQIFRRGNQKEIEEFLSNHGEKQLARNTDLLTQYDRSGSIVGPNGSDKDLILHGARNQIKL